MNTKDSLSPGVLSLIPLFYVGWSDSVLSPTEMKIIHKKIDSYDFLTDSDKDLLIRWSDPLNPPTDKQFRMWGNAIRKASQNFSDDKKQSLVDLGLEMASSSVQTSTTQNGNSFIANSPNAKKAILDMKEALGLNSESEQLLIKKIFPDQQRNTPDGSPSFDPMILKKILDGELEPTKDRMRKLLRDPLFALSDEQDKDKYREIILAQCKELANQGMSAYAFPIKYGGKQKSGEHIAVFEMLGYGDLSLSIKFGVQFGLFGGAVAQLGTAKHHEKYIQPLLKADLLGCFAMTETGHGSNVKNIETTATYDSSTKQLTIHSPNFAAGKEYIGNAMHSTMAAVFCQLIVDGESQGIHAVLAEIRDKS